MKLSYFYDWIIEKTSDAGYCLHPHWTSYKNLRRITSPKPKVNGKVSSDNLLADEKMMYLTTEKLVPDGFMAQAKSHIHPPNFNLLGILNSIFYLTITKVYTY